MNTWTFFSKNLSLCPEVRTNSARDLSHVFEVNDQIKQICLTGVEVIKNNIRKQLTRFTESTHT